MNVVFLRRWHRWISLPAALFLLFAATTGMIVAFTEFFGEEETKREALREVVSPVTTESSSQVWSGPLEKAFATVRGK
ncbi:MAG: hypothetical protein ABI877_05425, partial [Gemmatimonadaceae bacterium]